MKQRRFHITKDQGEIIILALDCYLDEIEKIIQKENTPYWRWRRINGMQLQKELYDYKWEVE